MTTITVTWDEWTSLLHRKRDVWQSTLTLELAWPSGSSNTLPICEVLTLCVSGQTLWEAKSFLQARNNMVQKCRGDTLCSAVLEHPCSMTAVIGRTCKSFISQPWPPARIFHGEKKSILNSCLYHPDEHRSPFLYPHPTIASYQFTTLPAPNAGGAMV